MTIISQRRRQQRKADRMIRTPSPSRSLWHTMLVVAAFQSHHNQRHYCCSAFMLPTDLVSQAFQAITISPIPPQPPLLNELVFAAVNVLDSGRPPSELISFPVTTTENTTTLGSVVTPQQLITKPGGKEEEQSPEERQTSFLTSIVPSSFASYLYEQTSQPISNTIALTKEEIELFQLVRQVAKEHCPRTTLRIGGGWVRDKLLKRDTTGKTADIDFVLDNMSGIQFATILHYHIMENNNVSAEEGKALLKSYGEESNHLQTASVKVGELWVDFNQLRFEKYHKDSRVPIETGIASVVEDAYRRDLTVNALYYNLNTNQVEDWTERGISDLQMGMIRPPNDAPMWTLLEDPLRALRAIRFAAQLSFRLHPALQEAVNPGVRKQLIQKVSKERQGKEIDLIFQSPDPTRGIGLLLETKLIQVIFPLQEEWVRKLSNNKNNNTLSSPSLSSIYKAGYDQLFRVQTLVSRIFTQPKDWDSNKRRYLWYAAFLNPFWEADCCCSTTSKKQKQQQGRKQKKNPIVNQLVVGNLRQSTQDSQLIEGVLEGASLLQKLLLKYDNSDVQALFSKPEVSYLSSPFMTTTDLRWMCYKTLQKCGPMWKESLLLALASSQQYDTKQAVHLYNEIVHGLEKQLGSITVVGLQPLLNGSQIKNRALPSLKGQDFKKILLAQEKWQVERQICGGPTSSREKEEAALIDYLSQTYPQYT